MFKNRLLAKGTWNISKDADSMRKKMTTHIQKVIVEMFEATRGNKREPKDT
jgi:hypothetical protein